MDAGVIPDNWQDLDDQDLVRLGQRVMCRIASLPSCSAGPSERLALFGNTATKVAVVSSPNCPPDAFELALADRSPYIRDAAVRNPNCPSDILRRFVVLRSQQPYIKVAAARLRVAGYSARQLADMHRDNPEDVYLHVAVKYSPNCPGELADQIPF